MDDYDYLSKFSKNLKKALALANEATLTHGASYVGSEHIVYGFLCLPQCSAYGALVGEGISKEEYAEVFFHSIDGKNTWVGFTQRTHDMFDRAIKFAVQTKTLAGTAHLLLSILECDVCWAVKILKRLGADIPALIERTEQILRVQKNRKELGYDDFDDGDGTFDCECGGEAETKGGFVSETGTEMNGSSSASKKGENRDADAPRRERTQMKDYGFTEKKKSASKNSEKNETLLQYGIDMTERARKGKIDPVIGRKKEIEKVIQVLSRRSKNNPVLVGEPGVGKSAIAEGLSQLIVEGDVPEQLYNMTVFSVDIPGMLAGARYRGDFEERLKDLIETVMKDGDIILFIDEIHTIVGAGSSSDNTMDAANILKPMLARGDLQVIGATTIEEYRKYIEKDSALERRFTPVSVEEPSETDTIAILKGLRPKYEEHHGIKITDDAIETAVKLSIRYITDRFLPDKAIDLIDEAAARARIMAEDGGEEVKELLKEAERLSAEEKMYRDRGQYTKASESLNEKKHTEEKIAALRRAQNMERDADGRYRLGKEQVAAIVSARMKIPLLKITQEEGEKLMRLEADLHKRIVGQNEAVEAVSKAIRRARAGLKDPSRPIGSFIFVGPTGVGKTDLCKALAEAMFGSEDQMIRLDMSEYMEKQSVSKLIGAPPGYVGYDDMQTGQLTDKVRTKPYCVILFDEIEKAHPDVFNLLLQLLDDGRLTDSKGRTVSFKNAIIILTSNIGAAEADHSVSYGFGGELAAERKSASDEKQYEAMKENITRALKERFRPEFLNRMDDVIVFHRLSESDAEQIGGKIVESLGKRLMEQRGILLSVTPAALRQLVKEGYDSQYGARPLKRIIQKRIEDRLSEEILLGSVANGQRVTVDYTAGGFAFLPR